MDKELLISKYKDLLLSLYSAKNYYGRIDNFLKEYNHYDCGGNVTFEFIAIFFKALYVLGIEDRNRFYFWKMFLICVLKYPKALPKAMTQAIYFVHFEKIFVTEICETSIKEKDFSLASRNLIQSK